ncbi:MAG: type II toxin-antitoxin system RelE/ParE family toxin [Spirochaetes bacterium]|nr:type II toxin-antitoxin system RelE/ParE family toxin [Spirochaetota bacterium]
MIVEKTETFDKWLRALKDEIGKAHILRRIQRIETEDFFGDHKKLAGCDLYELIIDYGPGYRVYFEKRVNNTIVFVLRGGKKADQKRDIKQAKKQAQEN